MNLFLKTVVVAAGIGLAATGGGTVDTDGTQGSYKPAMDGTETNSQSSAPQYKAGYCLPSSASGSACMGHQ